MRTEADTPIACTLAADVLGQRLASIRRLTDRSLVSHQLEGASLRLTYRIDALEELAQIVAKERECCAFLSYALEPSADAVRLTVHAPDGAGPDARWLFDQFLPQRQPVVEGKACGCTPGACG